MEFFEFYINNFSNVNEKILQQLFMVNTSMFFALLLGLPLGLLVSYHRQFKQIVYSVSSILWTIPSLALLALLLPFLGVGSLPAIVAITIYAISPILRSTYTGISEVPTETVDAAKAIGMTAFQRVLHIDLPLSMPSIISGIRTSAVLCIGVAILATYVGGGGLGDFIASGLSTQQTKLILLGTIPSAMIALFYDNLIACIERGVSVRRKSKWQRAKMIGAILLAAGVFIGPIILSLKSYSSLKRANNVITVASKNFTEQLIIGEILAQFIEGNTNFQVLRKFNLGTSDICLKAMLNKDIDIYPEYTGTAYMNVLKRQFRGQNKGEIFNEVHQFYHDIYHIQWLPTLGFNNSHVIAVKKSLATQYHIKTISDLSIISSTLILSAPPASISRQDVLFGLTKKYQLKFKKNIPLESGLLYQSLINDAADVIIGFSTDGELVSDSYQVLEDDLNFFPHYDLSILMRDAVVLKHPSLKVALEKLSHTINNEKMARMNHQVKCAGLDIVNVARQFLRQHALLS